MIARFGREILDPEGRIRRSALGRIVFADAEAREALNALTHPRVAEAIGRARGMDPEDVARATTRHFVALFRLPGLHL